MTRLSRKKDFSIFKQNFEMGGLALNNKTLDKYFSFLKRLDNNSKKRLIIKLTESLEIREKNKLDLSTLFGKWEDEKDSDTIIKEIRESRINNRNIEEF